MTSSGKADQEWIRRPERSSVATIRFIVWVALRFGRPAARLLLHPISLYFLVFSHKPRAASRLYLAKVLGRRPRWRDLYHHYHTFAACLLDRVFLLNGRLDLFDIRIHGEAVVAEVLAGGKGCLLLGAHLGSFEVVRALGASRPGPRVSLLMYEANARKIMAVLNAVAPEHPLDIIGLGRWDSMLEVEERLERGDFVGILGDRSLAGEDRIRHPFLGEPAAFPEGPFRIATLLRRPVVLMVGLYRGGRRYDVHFERLADLSAVPRKERPAAIAAALGRYAERLEHYCRLAPCNWFNFFDFWA